MNIKCKASEVVEFLQYGSQPTLCTKSYQTYAGKKPCISKIQQLVWINSRCCFLHHVRVWVSILLCSLRGKGDGFSSVVRLHSIYTPADPDDLIIRTPNELVEMRRLRCGNA
jgi:hypothetical protein